MLEERRRGFEDEEPGSESESGPGSEPGPGPDVQETGTRLYWDFGPRLDALDGDLSVVVGGRFHADAADFSENPEFLEAFGEPDPGGTARRAFLEVGGVYKRIEFNFWMNFAKEFELFGEEGLINSNPDFRNVFAGLFDVPVVGGVRAGYFKEPFGLEEITSSNDIAFMERSLTDAFVERRNLGVMIHNRFTAERRITGSLGVYQETNNELETADGYGVTARVTGVPLFRNDGRQLIHLGLSATLRKPSGDQLRFLSRPESAQAQIMADTGTFAADRDLRVGIEAATVLGPLSFQTEFMVAKAHRVGDGGDPFFPAAYVMGSYVLTGEHRSYRKRVGAFGSVHPERPFPASGVGAWEVTGRYSYLDLDSADLEGGVLHDWTAGLNWYLNDNLRMMFNYIAAHPEGFGFEHILQVRLQVSF